MSDRPWDNVGKVQPNDAAAVGERIVQACYKRVLADSNHCLGIFNGMACPKCITTALAEARREVWDEAVKICCDECARGTPIRQEAQHGGSGWKTVYYLHGDVECAASTLY